jgi:hypothetical protein
MVNEMEYEQNDVGDFGDARLKKRCGVVSAHRGPANRLSEETGRNACEGSSIWALAGE